MTRSIVVFAQLATCTAMMLGCGISAEDPALPEATAVQAQVVWAGGTQPSLKGAYWLKLDDNYGTVSANDNRRVAWNLETPGFGGFDAAGVAALFTSYQIQTLVRIGDSARPTAADITALNGATFSCSQLSASWLTALDNEAALVNAAISASPSSIGGFIFGNEPNIPAPTEWGIGGGAYARAYNCYVTRWNTGPKASYPLLIAGPGGCNNGAIPITCTSFWTGLFGQLGATADGFAIHAYGSSTFVTGADLQGFQDQANRINQSRPGSPIYITEFAVGGNQPPNTGGGEYFNQRHAEVRTYNQTHGGQIKALIYFVDALFGTRRGSCAGMTGDVWYATSLCDPAIRTLWKNASSAQITSPATNRADIVEGLSSVPAFQMPGQISTVSLVTRNPGTTTWAGGGASSMYRLATNSGNAFTFSSFTQCSGYSNSVLDGRIYTCPPVSPGTSYTYQVRARAPMTGPTSATLSVRMIQDGAQLFGYGAKFPVGLGTSSCGTAVTQCILFHRPDLLPFYAPNHDTSCGNRDFIVNDWCTNLDPTACNSLKAGVCSAFNSSCRCPSGFHLEGTAIPSSDTFCGYQVCGRDNLMYTCQGSSWSATTTVCK